MPCIQTPERASLPGCSVFVPGKCISFFGVFKWASGLRWDETCPLKSVYWQPFPNSVILTNHVCYSTNNDGRPCTRYIACLKTGIVRTTEERIKLILARGNRHPIVLTVQYFAETNTWYVLRAILADIRLCGWSSVGWKYVCITTCYGERRVGIYGFHARVWASMFRSIAQDVCISTTFVLFNVRKGQSISPPSSKIDFFSPPFGAMILLENCSPACRKHNWYSKRSLPKPGRQCFNGFNLCSGVAHLICYVVARYGVEA